MDVWVSQWHPDISDQEDVMAKTPMDLWNIVQDMLKRYPDEHITVTSAE